MHRGHTASPPAVSSATSKSIRGARGPAAPQPRATQDHGAAPPTRPRLPQGRCLQLKQGCVVRSHPSLHGCKQGHDPATIKRQPAASQARLGPHNRGSTVVAATPLALVAWPADRCTWVRCCSACQAAGRQSVVWCAGSPALAACCKLRPRRFCFSPPCCICPKVQCPSCHLLSHCYIGWPGHHRQCGSTPGSHCLSPSWHARLALHEIRG